MATLGRSACGTRKPTIWSATLRTGNSGPINSVAFAPHKRILATGSGTGTVQLWGLPADNQLERARRRHRPCL